MANEIDIGVQEPWAANNPQNGSNTYITVENPASIAGLIHTIKLYVRADPVGDHWYAGIFELISGNTYKCRTAWDIGDLTVGSKTISVTPGDVEVGDYLGVFVPHSGLCEIRGDSYANWVKKAGGNHCVVDNEVAYADINYRIHLRAIGDYVPPPRTGAMAFAVGPSFHF